MLRSVLLERSRLSITPQAVAKTYLKRLSGWERTLLSYPPNRVAPWRGETDIFIRPGFEFRLTDALITNFHLPNSTLLMLVSALMGRERMLDVYDHAIAEGYRFFSYGDASLLLPGAKKRQA